MSAFRVEVEVNGKEREVLIITKSDSFNRAKELAEQSFDEPVKVGAVSFIDLEVLIDKENI